MSCGQERSPILGIFTSVVVQLRMLSISCYFVGYFEHSRGFKFYDPTSKSFFEIGNAKFLEDVEFEGEDNIKKVVFEEELVSLPNVDIDDV